MQWSDKAIILSIKKLGEDLILIHALTKEHGLYAAYSNQFNNPRKRAIYQIGNLIEVTWKARLQEHLGSFYPELITSYAAKIIDNQLKINTLNSTFAIIMASLAERSPEKIIFNNVEDLLMSSNLTDHIFLKKYVLFELLLLNKIGYGLDLKQCAVTGSKENLIYVSPKTGRAVSKEIGEPYIGKIFTLPEFFINQTIEPNFKQILIGLKLTGYFLAKYIMDYRQTNIPHARNMLVDLISNNYK